VVLLVIGLVALDCFLLASRELRTAHRVFSTPTGRVSDLLTDPEGPIELHGTARVADGTVVGTFTGEACLLCETVIEEYRSGRHRGSWREIDSDLRSVPFLLEDGSGSVPIDPRDAEIRIGSGVERIDVDGGETPPERIERYIDATDGISCENRRFELRPFSIPIGADRRYTERRIRPGEEVYVLGRARPETTRAGSVNAVVDTGSDTPPLLIGDGSVRRNGIRALCRGGVWVVGGLVTTLVFVPVLVA
jgi:hypothetical protein